MISGTGRSGTNITKAIFAKHSRVAALPFEYRIVVDPGGILDFYHSFVHAWSPFVADKKIKELEKFLLTKARLDENIHAEGLRIKEKDPTGRKITPPSYHGWELEKWIPGYSDYVSELIEQLTGFKYRGRWPGTDSFSEDNRMYFSDLYNPEKLKTVLGHFINNLTQSILRHQKKELYADDNTWNILYADTLLDMLPHARLIHIIRDPRDVVASFVKQNWCPDNLHHAIKYYQSIIQRWLSIEQSLKKDQYLNIKFEEMIRKPEDIVREMCRFSNLEFQTNMIRIDLSKSNTGRWKNDFSATEIKTIESELHEEISQLGYHF